MCGTDMKVQVPNNAPRTHTNVTGHENHQHLRLWALQKPVGETLGVEGFNT